MTITSRDQALLAKLGAMGILSTSQIGKLFFSGVDPTTVRRRLRALERERSIYRVLGLDDGSVGWALTRPTAQRIGAIDPPKFNRNSLHHDVVLSDVRLSFESIGLGSHWVPEHHLKRKRLARGRGQDDGVAIPDAIFSAVAGNTPRIIALELELTGKSRQRYEQILTRYLKTKHLWAVWYLVQSESLGKLLIDVWRALNRGKRNDLLIWSRLDEVLADPAEARVHAEHFNYRLRELVQISPALTPALGQSGQSRQKEALSTDPPA